MVICLDPGHSYGLNNLGSDPGAVNRELNLKESVIALEMVFILREMFLKDGYNVVCTRTNGSDTITLRSRCKFASEKNADLFVSIHLNSSDNTSAHGIETLRYDTSNSLTIQYADEVQKELIKATNARDRGVKLRNDLYVLKHTTMPAILVETGFISNKEEALKLNDPAYQRTVCQAIYQGIKNVSSRSS